MVDVRGVMGVAGVDGVDSVDVVLEIVMRYERRNNTPLMPPRVKLPFFRNIS